jgi:hypothetical protein
VARAEEKHGRQRDPAAHGMDDDRAGEVVKLLAKSRLEPGLDAEGLVPGYAFKEGIDEADEHEGGDQLRVEFGSLGNAAGNDGRDRRRESQQEEELGQFVTVLRHQRFDAAEEIDPVGDAVANEEVGYGRHAEIGQNLDQRIDLVLFANRADLKEGKACVHGQHHDGAEQDKQYVAAGLNRFHG